MVTNPKKEIGTFQESTVEVVMNARARGKARAVPPMKTFRPWELLDDIHKAIKFSGDRVEGKTV